MRMSSHNTSRSNSSSIKKVYDSNVLVLFLLLLTCLESCSVLLVSCFTTITTTVPPTTASRVLWGRHNNAGGGGRGWGEKSSYYTSSSSTTTTTTTTCLNVYFTGMDNYREADYTEQTLGARRHDTMSILPDSMLDTTLFVGNLCEFVSDQDLSELFTSASHFLQFVPAVVIRKPDLTSLQYGFVTFPSIIEKEAALERFHGYKWRGKRLKVEPIRDFVNTKTGQSQRVRIPERMVAYVSGAIKKPALSYSSSSSSSSSSPRRGSSSGSAQNGAVLNTMRRATSNAASAATATETTTKKEAARDGSNAAALQLEQQQIDYRKVLNHREQSEYARAVKKGFVTFTGCRKKAGSTSSLAKLFRSWCDNRYKPNIRLYKATNGHMALDQVVIDISPLVLYRRRLMEQDKQNDNEGKITTEESAEMLLQNDVHQYKEQVFLAATKHGMVVLKDDNDEDEDDNDKNDSLKTMQMVKNVNDSNNNNPRTYWHTPLAIMNIGIFQGERSQAKAMVKELALLWEIPEMVQTQPTTTGKNGDASRSSGSGNNQSSNGRSSSRPGRQADDGEDDDDERSISNGRRRAIKTKGLSRHRTRGGGHRQSWY